MDCKIIKQNFMFDERNYAPMAGESEESAKRMESANETAEGNDSEAREFTQDYADQVLGSMTEEDKDRMMKNPEEKPETSH